MKNYFKILLIVLYGSLTAMQGPETALVAIGEKVAPKANVSWTKLEPVETGLEVAVIAEPDAILNGINTTANLAVYSFIDKLKYPTILVLGTEGAAMIQLSCATGNPYQCLASYAKPEFLYNALNAVAGGVTYAIGEKIEKTMHQQWQMSFQNTPLSLARSALTTLAAGGMSYIILSSDPEESPQKAMLASLFSGLMLAALKNTIADPAFDSIKNRIATGLGQVSQKIGTPVAVVTAVTGTAAIAYAVNSQAAVINALNQARNYLPAVGVVKEMVRNNYLWMQGYRGMQKGLGYFARSAT